MSEVNKSERRMSGKSSLECTGGSARVRAHFPDAIVFSFNSSSAGQTEGPF